MASPHIRPAAPEIAGGLAGTLPGAITGAAVSNHFFPATVHLAEGIAVNARLGSKTDVAYGPTALNLPHALANTPLGHVGMNVDISQFNVALSGKHGIAEIVGLASQFHDGVEQPIIHAVVERLAIGGGLGALIGAAAGSLAISKLRQKGLKERFGNLADNFRNHKLRTSGAVILAAGGLTGCGAVTDNFMNETIPAGPPPTPLASILPSNLNTAPILKDATISSTGGSLVKLLVNASETYVTAVDTFLNKSATNFNKAYASYARGPATEFSGNDVTGIMQIADIHCNYAFYNTYLPAVIKAYRPDIIEVDGDTETNSGTMPYEKDCISGFVNDVSKAAKQIGKPISLVGVTGNHDKKRPMPGITTLDKKNNYSAAIDGITFVGDDDPTNTVWSTYPASIVDQNKLVVQEGATVADVACGIKAKTGIAPRVVVHNPGAGFETILRGCASMVDSAHTHNEQPVEQYQAPNGQAVLEHNVGTATGAQIGFTIYQTPQLPAVETMQYYDKNTQRYLGFVTTTLSAAGNVNINVQSAPYAADSNQFDINNAQEYEQIYSAK